MSDTKLLSKRDKQNIINLPTKLPMIVKPKLYNKNSIGGYLLNDEEFAEPLLIEKKGYGVNSVVEEQNKIYDMINGMNSIGFKVNTEFLSYISDNWVKHDLLLDPSIEHEYASYEKRSKSQQSEYESYNSKVILQ